MNLNWLKRLIGGAVLPEPALPDTVQPDAPAVDWAKVQRDNAIVYTAKQAAAHAMQRGDHVGATLDMVRTLRRYGWDAPWLGAMAAEAMMKRDSRGFVQGFACDEAAAEAWLATNELSSGN